jgi:hypothetical protein
VKLDLYRKLTNTLSICVMIAVAGVGYEVMIQQLIKNANCAKHSVQGI